jgi:hypothetical protein
VPTAIIDGTGLEHVFVRGTDQDLYYQHIQANGLWTGWIQAGPGGGWADGHVGLVTNISGRVEAFESGGDGAVYHNIETSVDNWRGWHAVSGGGWVSSPITSRWQNGTIDVAVLGGDHYLYHTWQTSPGADSWQSPLSPIEPLQVTTTKWLTNATVWPDGRVEVMSQSYANSELLHIWQGCSNGCWSNWSTLNSGPLPAQ